jgi:cytochrome c5
MRKTVVVVAAVAGLMGMANAAKLDLTKLPPPSDKKGVTYAKDVKPILDRSCQRCHGAERPKARFSILSLDSVLKGSEDGKVVQPGKSKESKLVHLISRLEGGEAMPPDGKGDPLTKEEVGLIRAWIDQGAK